MIQSIDKVFLNIRDKTLKIISEEADPIKPKIIDLADGDTLRLSVRLFCINTIVDYMY